MSRLDRWPRWMEALALCVVAVHKTPPVDRRSELVGLIAAFLAEHEAAAGESEPPSIVALVLGERADARPRLEHDWPIAEIASVPALAEHLELSDGQLAWLADVRGLERSVTAEQLRNYRYRAVARASGLPRVIEAPKARLKEIQRWVLREILAAVAAHPAAQGFTRGRSVLTHARLHSGQSAVLRLDLSDFFASVTAGRVFGIFRTLGYAGPVAHNARKSVLHTAGARQSVCGVVVNVRPNVVRAEYDQLKAILHNAAHHGPQSQNRAAVADFEAHLRGRVSWVCMLNPARGEKLRRRLAQISWDDSRAPGG